MQFSADLYPEALKYLEQGYSVIPVYGASRPDRFKAAAVRWTRYQREHANSAQLNDWFNRKQFGGLAIVCGQVSRLAVLDFDNMALAELFYNLHPDLAHTRIVRSGGRGLPHFYYHIPANLTTHSRSINGVDWQYNGRYVIAPPTSDADRQWQVAQAAPVKILSQKDLDRIMAFLNQVNEQQPAIAAPQPDTPTIAHLSANFPPLANIAPVDPDIAIARYRQLATEGRNNALFKTCIWLRNHGGTVADALCLVEPHIHQPAANDHRRESAQQRRDEAIRTIYSVFSRASRYPTAIKSMPNSLREALLKHQQMAVLRVIEVLIREGYTPEQTITRKMLLTVARRYGVGDWSVRAALHAQSPTGEAIFLSLAPENAASAKSAIAASGNAGKPSELNAIEFTVTEPTRNRGRVGVVYRVPCLRGLCSLYGVKWSPGDHIADEALCRVSCFRRALHVALIARRPGLYSRGWLANRLGVTARTIARYNQVSPLQITPTYFEQFLSWKNVQHAFPEDAADYRPHGAFLEDETGKRYPPKVEIATWLMRHKHTVVYKRRRFNQYSVRPAIQMMPSSPVAMPISPEPLMTKAPLVPLPIADIAATPVQSPSALAVPVVVTALTPSQQAIADRLYALAQGQLSHVRAITLVREYGQYAVEDVADTLVARGDAVTNPAAFVVSLLRARYGSAGQFGLTEDELLAAEMLYVAVASRQPARKMRWQKVIHLVRDYGRVVIQQAIAALRETPNVTNPAGFVMKHIQQGQAATNEQRPEQVVTLLMEAVRSLAPDHAMAKPKAVELVNRYGTGLVMQAIRVLKARHGIENPAGFVVVYLRSSAKKAQQQA